MSNIAFRDSSVIVIETSRTLIRATLGLLDVLRPNSVEVLARVGLRKNTNVAQANGAGESVAESSNGFLSRSNVKVNEYLVGSELDNALLVGEDIAIFWPFADGEIRDFTQAEALWKYTLFNRLGVKRTQNESPALLTVVYGLSRDTQERICQIFFERFNIAGLSIIERPLAQLFAANSLSGLVVDVGRDKTDITPLCDCIVQHNCCDTIPIGISDCEHYLAHLLKSNQDIVNTLSPEADPLEPEVLHNILVEVAQQIWQNGLVRVPVDGEIAPDLEDEGVTSIAAVLVAGKEKAVIETGMKKKATAKASAAEQARAKEIEALDLVTFQFHEHSLTVGRERHRFAEPLFDPAVLDGVPFLPKKPNLDQELLSLQNACGYTVARADINSRFSIWSGILVTGDCTSLVKGLGAALQSRLSPFMLSNTEYASDVQPRHTKVLRVPEYFGEFREKADCLAAFLGASIVAKIIFSDPLGKNFVSKTDYSTNGPHIILNMSPSLL